MGKSKSNNVFISHHGKDDDKVQRLKERFAEKGYNVRNYSVDSTKHTEKRRPSNQVITRFLRRQISWSGSLICLVGPETYKRKWVNDEIKMAFEQGKKIIGIYAHGNNEEAELPRELKKRHSAIIGWNSLDKLIDIINGKESPVENPSGETKSPMYTVATINC